MVLTKIPMIPLGESLPPTMLKPRLFFPGPFSNARLNDLEDCGGGRLSRFVIRRVLTREDRWPLRGRVQNWGAFT